MVRNSFLPQIFCGVFIYKSESFELQLDASVVPVLVGLIAHSRNCCGVRLDACKGISRQIASEDWSPLRIAFVLCCMVSPVDIICDL